MNARRTQSLWVPFLVALTAHAVLGVAGNRMLARRAASVRIAPRVVPGPILLQLEATHWEAAQTPEEAQPAIRVPEPRRLASPALPLPSLAPRSPVLPSADVVRPVQMLVEQAVSGDVALQRPPPPAADPKVTVPPLPVIELDGLMPEEEPPRRLPDIAAQVVGKTVIEPRYPMSSRLRGEEGTAVIRASIGPRGRATAVTVEDSSGHAELDRAAVRAIREARFALPEGFEGTCDVRVPIAFRLRD